MNHMTEEKICRVELIGKVNQQLKREMKYYVVSLSALCFILSGALFWCVNFKEQPHNFDCEIVISPKSDNYKGGTYEI